MWPKRVSCFGKRLSGVKKTNSPVFYEKYSKESKTQLRQFIIVVVVVLILTLSFFTILTYLILSYFILLFLPGTFSGIHVRTVRTGSYSYAPVG